jgi:cytochrome c peroxidase
LGRQLSGEDTKAIVTFLGALKGRVDENYIRKPELPADGPDTPKAES